MEIYWFQIHPIEIENPNDRVSPLTLLLENMQEKSHIEKESIEPKPVDNIDVTTHPTYQQLLLRIKQVLSDHSKGEKLGTKQK